MGPRALGRRAGPPEDQVRDARLREDRRASALSLLRQRHVRRAHLAARSCSRTTTRSSTPPARPPTGRWGSPAKSFPARTRRPSSSAGTTAIPTTPTSRWTCCAAERAVVIGNGNVALDVARMLVLAPDELAPTDTADHALEVLGRSRGQRGRRRGPPRAGPGGVHQPRAARAGRARGRGRDRRRRGARARRWRWTTRRPTQMRPRGATSRSCAPTPQREPPGTPKRVVLRFLLSPTALRGGRARPSRRGRARAQRARRRRRRRAARKRHRRARDDRGGARCSARSATAASPLPGVPFDERAAVIPNDGGPRDARRPASRCPASTWSAGSSAAPRA